MPRVPGSEATYAAADVFRRQCFITGKSFFWTTANVWSDEALKGVVTLLEAFPKGPNVVSRLANAVQQHELEARLLVELIALYHLFPYRTSRDTKVQIIRDFAIAENIALPTDEPWEDCFNKGIGNTGIHYQTSQIRQLLYFAKLAQTLRTLTSDIDDPQDVNKAATEAQMLAKGAPEGRSVILHLWFPEDFEPIVSLRDKRRIIKAYEQFGAPARDLDHKLHLIRRELESQRGRSIQFYEPEIQSEWDTNDASASIESQAGTNTADLDDIEPIIGERQYWIEKTRVTGRPDRESGDYQLGRVLWSPKISAAGRDIYWAMREVRPGDIILHLTDNSAITAMSVVESPAEDFLGIDGTDWAGQAALLVRLKDFTRITPPIVKSTWQSEPYATRLREVAKRHSGLFYQSDLNLNQGGYLTRCPAALINALAQLYGDISGGEDFFAQFPAKATTDQTVVRSRFLKLKEKTLWSEERLNELLDLLQTPGVQVVLAGPPGTGKTWVMRAIIDYLTGERQERVRFVQFHPAYTYEQFIEGMRPTSAPGGGLTFSPQPGVILDFISQMKDDEPHYILIDEINRANLPRVFGELLVLFEYRDEPITLPYSGQFALPENLHFVGTMNTADRSIRSVDAAFRRRFDIIECAPDGAILDKFYEQRSNTVPTLRRGFEELNKRLVRDLGRHYQIGHAFFMKAELTLELLHAIWKRKVFPLIEEYFFDQTDRLTDYQFESFWPGADNTNVTTD